jgi:hypothetical protein
MKGLIWNSNGFRDHKNTVLSRTKLGSLTSPSFLFWRQEEVTFQIGLLRTYVPGKISCGIVRLLRVGRVGY